jgi:predicted nucleotidyltransferase
MNKEYILNFLTTHKQELQNNYALTKIGLFGSYAKNTANENSDIDIVILCSHSVMVLKWTI